MISNFGIKAAALAIISSILIIAAVWFAIVKLNGYLNPPSEFYGNAENLKIETYSSSGQVKAAEDDRIVVTVGQVTTGKQGNELRYFDKTVYFGAETKFFRRIEAGRSDFTQASKADIAPGKDVTVYTKTNPYDNDVFAADRIDIN